MTNPDDSPAIGNDLRSLPSIHDLLSQPAFQEMRERYPGSLLTQATRDTLAVLRSAIQNGTLDLDGLRAKIAGLPQDVECRLRDRLRPKLRRVINATGVILQTNLGRAPLSRAALEGIREIAGGYCNLEYDLDRGVRSQRDVHAESLILDVLRSRDALQSPQRRSREVSMGAAVVNNCAAATFLALNTLAQGGEVIVSRGELVEIGGGFRIPDILAKSGAVLREVGTTNKTRLQDYAAAINANTRLILRVHRSNFSIEGFTEQPSITELVDLGRAKSIPVFDDQGTGCVMNLEEIGLPRQSNWLKSIASGSELVACSGDKLLGGPQCGILVGSSTLIASLRDNPLFRAFRVDKLTYAALEATLLAYLSQSEGDLPVIRMLRSSAEEIRARCIRLAEEVGGEERQAQVVETSSVVGGGTTPGAVLASFAVALNVSGLSATKLLQQLRSLEPAVIARIREERVVLDLRTVAPAEDAELAFLLRRCSPWS